MLKKSNIVILFFLALIILGAAFYYFKNSKKTIRIAPAAETAEKEEQNIISNPVAQPIFVSGWLPYWEKEKGAASLEGNMDIFNEINPFAFEVNQNGNLLDIAKINSAPWLKLIKEAKEKNVNIVPTILWGDAAAMHKIFTDKSLMLNHIDAVLLMLEKNNFSGVDIDYEGKDVADRDNFTLFLKSLDEKLKNKNKTLSCTIEARTQDLPPEGFTGIRAMSWANDLSALNNICDVIRIMAYDEDFQIYRARNFEKTSEIPTVSNADIRWVEDVVKYSLKYIAPEKFMLGVPTYGWEFSFEKISKGHDYTRVKSVSYPEAVEKAQKVNVIPIRTDGGELSFVYKTSGEQHIVVFSDAESVRQKIELAKKFNLKGISIFKIDGLADSQLYPMLKDEIIK